MTDRVHGYPADDQARPTGERSIVAEVLTVHGPVHRHEIDGIEHHWTKLDHRLRSFAHLPIALELHVHDRDTPDQHVVLEATIGTYPTFVATARSRHFGAALSHVRDELVRQLTDAKNRAEPRHQRRLRSSA